MPFHLNRRAVLLSGVAALTVTSTPHPALAATTHEVQMLNVDPDDRSRRQIFLPRILVVEPGDTVKFVSTDRSHNSASVDGMLPEGAEEWNGRINEDVEVTFDLPGLYGYQCTPHATLGMVGLVIVRGDGVMDNLEAAQSVRQRGRAQQAWDEIWAEVAEMEDLTG